MTSVRITTAQEAAMNTLDSTPTVASVMNRVTLVVTADDVNESAFYCVQDATACLARYEAGELAPFGGSWLISADAWAIKAGQHQFGFALPAGW